MFIETIRFEAGKYHLPEFHQDRVNRTFGSFYSGLEPLQLDQILPDLTGHERSKVRVEYDSNGYKIDQTVYQPKAIQSLKIMETDLDYSFKFADREELNKLVSDSGADEVILVKNGLITDSSYSNLAFFDGEKWFTPKVPLLEGVRRRWLLEQGRIHPVDMTPDDLKHFQKVSLINAMLDLGEVEVTL